VIAHHQLPGTASRFVPGYPVELLACRYHGGNQLRAFGSLAGFAHFASGQIAAQLNAAPSELGGPPLRFCPIDFGEKIILIFGYSKGTRLTASIDMGGCRVATNGDRSISSAPVAVLARLEAVLGHDVN
jgi:predicted alpha/beta hydrolase